VRLHFFVGLHAEGTMFKSIVTGFNGYAVQTSLYLYCLVLFSVSILFFSVTPMIAGGINSGLSAHVCGYFIFSFTALLFFRAKGINSVFLKAALFAGMYGVFIEIIQLFLPYRLFEFLDIVVNFSAAVVGTVPGYFLVKHKWI
jgi:glycopeptide antibiotics resistance protein